MVDIAGTAEGRSDDTALVLVGDEVLDWTLIAALQQSLPRSAHTPFADKLRMLVARREQAIRRAARQRGRKVGGSNWSIEKWRAQRQWAEDKSLKELHRPPTVLEVQTWLGLNARTERKYRRQWGVPSAWTPAENDERWITKEQE